MNKQAWIIVSDRANMDRSLQPDVFRLNSGSQRPQMNFNDKLIASIRKEVTFFGMEETKNSYHIKSKRIFERGFFQRPIDIRLNLYSQRQNVNVWKLVDELEFANGKLNWQGGLAGGMRKIPLEDFETIANTLSQKMALTR